MQAIPQDPLFQQPQLPPQGEIDTFKTKVKRWLTIDEEIAEYEKKIKELKALKNKQLEPQITEFMRQYNIKDLNTESGKIRCNERKTKRALNRANIQDNLSKVIHDDIVIEQAMNLIMNNREVKISYKLTKPKK
tara:strand:+ start:381 stop:782 length:402 start_codon:yes stop_codon:yes gene_type:complete